MPLDTPVSILFNSDGIELAVSGGTTPPVSTSAIMFAGIDAASTARVLRTHTDGTLFVTGTVAASISSVAQGNSGSIAQSWYVQLTNGTSVIGQAQGNALFVTGNLTVTNIVTTSLQRATSSSVVSVARNAASTTILAANGYRNGASIFNDSNAVLYLRLSAGTASSTSYSTKLGAQSYFEVPTNYSGAITGIWASAGIGNAYVTEYTPT
ncbi:MAG TPA: hypothetical protein PLP33_23690 [Leptospiraceae bacterium]|nr:hypothetical protein [Leptospiraceae bacterium]